MYALHAKVEPTGRPKPGRWSGAHDGRKGTEWLVPPRGLWRVLHAGLVMLAVLTPCLLGTAWSWKDSTHAYQQEAMPSTGTTPSSREPDMLAGASSGESMDDVERTSRVPVLFASLLGIPMGYLTHRVMRRRHGLHRELGQAIRKSEFIPYYQPLVRAAGMEWAGVEVLARWAHPTRGVITPDRFMSRLERTELILPMTAQLMIRAADELAEMLPLLPAGFHVAFNITPAHLAGRWLPEQCRRFLAAFPAGKVSLVLELTEREGVEADGAVLAVLEEIRRMGVRIALDDFGVGHSNLSQLQELQVDLLKIDQGFVTPLVLPDQLTPILRTILDLAERLDLEVVAEGVETWAQAEALARHGADLLQGYLFARPMAGQDLPAVLARAPISLGRSGVDANRTSQSIDSKEKIHA